MGLYYSNYNTFVYRHKIPDTTKILVFGSFTPHYFAIFDTVSNHWSTDQTLFSEDISGGKILPVYGTHIYIYNGLEDIFAHCPNSSSAWQQVTDVQPMKAPRYVNLAALVPISLLKLSVTCTPANYQWT